MPTGCWSENDDTFGPQVLGCRGDFDFTVYFEEIIMSIVPATLAILCVLIRWRYLRPQPVCTHAGTLLPLKIAAWISLCCLQIATLTLWALSSSPRTPATIPASALNLLLSLLAVLLSPLEHRSSIRPSTVLSAYLFLTALLDIAVTRTLWFALPSGTIPGIFSSCLVLKLVLLLLESLDKRSLLHSKDEPPAIEATSNIFNRSLFLWLNPLLWRGNGHDISIDDLPTIDSALSQGDEFSKEWTHDSHQSKRHRLLYVLVKDLRWAILAGVLPRLTVIGFKYVQPFMINRMVRWLEEPPATNLQNEGYGLVAAFALVFIGLALCNARYQHLSYRMVVAIRTRMVSVIYRKNLTMDLLQVESRAPLTLMSTDVERISAGLGYIHDLWGSIVEVAVAIWLLWRELQISAVAVVIIASSCVVIAMIVGKASGHRQQAWIEAVQKRIAITSSVLPHMKDIKVVGMVDSIITNLERYRLNEVKASKRWRWLQVLMIAVGFFNSALSPVISLTSYVLTSSDVGSALTLPKAMTVLSIFALVGAPLNLLSESASGLFTGIACIERIRQFLVSPDRPQHDRHALVVEEQAKRLFNGSNSQSGQPENSESEKEKAPIRLTDVTFAWNQEGDSTLSGLSLTVEQATLTVLVGPVGCGKSTLLQGLLSEIHKVHGDMSIRASRIAYCSQTPWITNATLRENIIGCTPYDARRYQEVIRCCGLVQDISNLAYGDETKLGSGGSAISGGQKQRVSLARAAYSMAEILLLDDVLSGLDSSTEERVLRDLLGPEGLLHRQRNCLAVAARVVWLDRTGRITNQETVTESTSSSSSLKHENIFKKEVQPTTETDTSTDASLPTHLEETLKQRKGGWRVLQYYILRMGSRGTLFFAVLMIFFVFFYGFPPVWVALWANASGRRVRMYVGIYYAIGTLQIVLVAVAAGYLLLFLLPRASINFHRILLKVTTSASLSFLTGVDVGVTTNRFSQDLQLIDTELPISLLNTTVALGSCTMMLVIICVSGRYIAAIIPFLLGALYLVQRFYLHSSRQIRLLDIAAKAPLFSHFTETLDGLVTLRAFGWQTPYEESVQKLLATSQKPFYTLYSVQRWLILVLDLIIAGLAIVFAGVAVAAKGSLASGLVGLALVNVISLNNNVKLLVIQWTILETSIAAVARIRAYESVTPSEVRPNEDQEPPQDWPRHGRLEIIQASASYSEVGSPVLNNIFLSIPSGTKVGVCGRSGSGKSSLFSVITRMLDLKHGSVLVDDINIATIPRSKVRARLNVIPQNPYFIPNTSVRASVDPFANLDDRQIISILKEAQLWDHLGGDHSSLDLIVSGSLLSHGQRQLLSIARALARRASTGNILLLDEVTSQLDSDMEETVRQVIHRCFSGHTVIAIAHRLDTIVDYDLVVVLDKGSVIEFGTPKDLLSQSSSAFRELYEKQKSGK